MPFPGPIMRQAIETFLQLVTGPVQPSETRLEQLAAALDHLIYRASLLPSATSCRDAVDVVETYEDIRDKASERFPEIGSYNVADPLGSAGEVQFGLGDGIDDITDIFLDLVGTRQLIAKDDDHAAEVHFRFLFEVHWGQHAIELRAYLHALIHAHPDKAPTRT